jgi:hypothetical protein
VNSVADRYQPRWLFLDEFAGALRPGIAFNKFSFEPTPDSEEQTDVKDAIALLVRDRIIVDGRLNEAEFRFLEGKPDLRTTAWVNQLTADDFNWSLSHIIAGVDTTKSKGRLHDHIGLLIEIAASALAYFGQTPEAARRSPQEIQDGPEVRRAKAVLKKLYDDRIPSAEQLTDGDLHKAVNQAREKDAREISKTTILRASGRRNDQQSK